MLPSAQATESWLRAGLDPRACLIGAALAVLSGSAAVAEASETATAKVTVQAQFSSRTSLHVSSEILRFEIVDSAQGATVSVDFSAAVRIQAGADAVLSIERLDERDGRPGAEGADGVLTFAGEGEGTTEGRIGNRASTVAGRWVGSGSRQGRFVFTLRARPPGVYTLPVRFALTVL